MSKLSRKKVKTLSCKDSHHKHRYRGFIYDRDTGKEP